MICAFVSGLSFKDVLETATFHKKRVESSFFFLPLGGAAENLFPATKSSPLLYYSITVLLYYCCDSATKSFPLLYYSHSNEAGHDRARLETDRDMFYEMKQLCAFSCEVMSCPTSRPTSVLYLLKILDVNCKTVI